MALTYTQLSALMQDYLQNSGTEFVAAIPDIVKSAEDRIYRSVQIPTLRKNQVAAMTSGNRFLTLPSDFLSSYSFAITTAGSYYYLLEKEVSFIGEACLGVASAQPRYYALFDDNTFLLGPTPDSAYDVELHYFYEPASIVDTGTSWLGDNAEAVLLYACLTEGYVYMKGDADQLGVYTSRYNDALADLKKLGEGYAKRDNLRFDAPKMIPT